MAVKKFKISLDAVPANILKTEEGTGDKYLHLRLRTTRGEQVDLHLKDGDVVKTEDLIVALALESYIAPRVPIHFKAKDALEATRAVAVSDTPAFTKVAATAQFQHTV